MGKRIKLQEQNLLGKGYFGEVYAIGDFAVKVYKGRNRTCSCLIPRDPIGRSLNIKLEAEKDHYTAGELYNAGVSVPRPYGLIRVEHKGQRSVGYVMEKIRGRTLDDLRGSARWDRLRSEGDSEVEKAEQLGFVMSDMHDNNIMIRDDDEKAVIVDVGYCESPKKHKEVGQE